MDFEKDFRLYARDKGISGTKLDGYAKYSTTNGIIEPYILEERALNCAPMSVFSRLMYDRIIFLGTDINSDVANIINAQMLYLNSTGDEDIKMFINSPGGSVVDGLAIYDVMNFVTPDVSTYCMGMCASMGSILVSSGEHGKRYCLPNGQVMIHQVSGYMGGACADMEINYRLAKNLQDKLYNILSKNTGKTFDEITKDADRDNWMTAEECLPGAYGELGLIDSIITKIK